jgi:peptidylprolyl isomerase
MSTVKDILKDNKKILLLTLGLLVACFLGVYFIKNGSLLTSSDLSGLGNSKTYSAPQQVLQNNTDYKAVLKTSYGDITIDLFESETPTTVNNFVFLAQDGFYSNMIFHRVIKDFIIQTGDPKGTGIGGPGYYIADEITDRKFAPYMVGMANAGTNTNGSQFFITAKNISQTNINGLNGKYTIFGEVVSGFSVVDAINSVQTNSSDKPISDVKLLSVEIIKS